MGGVTLKNGLDNYLNRLKAHKGQVKLDMVCKEVANLGVEICAEEYAKTGVNPTSITANINNNSVNLIAHGSHLAFSEYGTGLVGEGTYEGDLPTQTLIFESPKGEQQSTQGWEYYYNNPKTKIMGGWFYGNNFTQGQKAQAQMWKTSRRLREEMPKQIKEKLKRSGK